MLLFFRHVRFLCIIRPIYIETVPHRNSPPALLLRQGWREGGKTRKRTLANLSHWPPQKIENLRRLLRDEELVSPQDLCTTRQTLPHGHLQALLAMIRQLGLDPLIARQRSRERDWVVAMIAQRLLAPSSEMGHDARGAHPHLSRGVGSGGRQ